jgi:Glutaminase
VGPYSDLAARRERRRAIVEFETTRKAWAVTIQPATLAKLRAIFGDCVPQQNAVSQLEQSPLAPTSALELQALRDAVVEAAGKKLVELASYAEAARLPSSVVAQKQPDAQRLLLAQVQAARGIQGPGALRRVLTEAQLAQVFTRAAENPDILWRFLEEGCLHRAHVLAKDLEDAGYFSEKIFTIPLGGDLVMETEKARLGFTVCWYHEAVSAWVQTKDGVERRVIDPSFGDRALSVQEWLAAMHSNTGTPLETFYLPRFAYGLGARNDPPTAWNLDDLATARSWKDEWRAVEQSLDDMDFYAQLKELAGRT